MEKAKAELEAEAREKIERKQAGEMEESEKHGRSVDRAGI